MDAIDCQRDQDLTDFMSEFYIFVIFGYDAEIYPNGIKNWEDLQSRFEVLKKSTQDGQG